MFRQARAPAAAALRQSVGLRHASLRDIKVRIKSVESISKITKSMQMVASAKLRAAQNKVPAAKAFGDSVSRVVLATTPEKVEGTNNLFIVVTSDRGLCGGINSGIVKEARKLMREIPGSYKLVCVGGKGASQLVKSNGSDVVATVVDLGKKPVTFNEISEIAELTENTDYDQIYMLHNHFVSVIAYTPTRTRMLGPEAFATADAGSVVEYEVDDEDELRDYHRFQLAGSVWNAVVQNQTSELGARMTSMDNATRNAKDIAQRLTRQYNRGRQSSITTELIEIISGAAAIESQN